MKFLKRAGELGEIFEMEAARNFMARWRNEKKRSEIMIPEMKEGPGGGKKLRNYMKLQICARMQRTEKKGQIEQELSILVAKIRHLGTLPVPRQDRIFFCVTTRGKSRPHSK